MVKREGSGELEECKNYLEQLAADPNCAPFLEPVAWREMGLDDYPKIIKKPMDLGTIRKKLNASKYESAADFHKDIKLIWKNCMTYNADGSPFYNLAGKLERKTDREINKILKKYNVRSTAKSSSKSATVEEKANFCKLMHEINEVQLGKIVQLLDDECEEALDKSNPDEVEVNVDAIDLATFKKLDALIKGFAKEGRNGSKKQKLR